MNTYSITNMIGKTFTAVTVNDEKTEMDLHYEGGRFRFEHMQECCESVYITDIEGDLDSLVGSPILVAQVVIEDDTEEDDEHGRGEISQWTFYKVATVKGWGRHPVAWLQQRLLWR